jgi:hypothetical protein
MPLFANAIDRQTAINVANAVLANAYNTIGGDSHVDGKLIREALIAVNNLSLKIETLSCVLNKLNKFGDKCFGRNVDAWLGFCAASQVLRTQG